jgi:hypothetical protein
MLHKRDRTIITDDLDRLAVDRRKTGAQGFMTIDKGLETVFKSRNIELPSKPQDDGYVIGGAFRKEVVEKPEPLLGKGEPKIALPS